MGREKMLDFLKRVADGIAMMFGNNCEVVIRDIEDHEATILYNTSKQLSERDEFTTFGKSEMDKLYKGIDIINNKGITENNHFIKCSTFHAKGNGYHFALGIHYDYTNMLMVHSVVSDLIHVGNDYEATVEKDEHLERQLDEFFANAVEFIGKPIAFMRKKERVEMVRYLHEKGAFSIHKSIPIIADKMNISRYTIYNYLREIKGLPEKISKK